jgi:3-oxoacyl-[acyl-carrier-protein] synthase II
MREAKRVVITGLGVVSSLGLGKDAFSEAISSGASGIKPISLFDTSGFTVKTAGEIKDFAPQDILGAKGLRNLDRSTKLINCATKLALDDAQLEITEENTRDTAVVVGDTLGSLPSIFDFDKEAMLEGPHYVNPALFPNTVINSPASQVSIRFNIRGFNTTISTGFRASLDALSYAADFIRFGRAKCVLAGGVEELCLQTFLGFYKTGCLAGLDDGAIELSCPFDRRRNGFIFGEGAGMLALEDLDSALGRKAKIYAEVMGAGCGLGGLERSMQKALDKSGLAPADIDYICAAANSTPETDFLETRAIKKVFGDRALKVAVSSVKSMLGECFSASGVLQTAAAACAIENQRIPPTINYEQKDGRCDLNYVLGKAKEVKVERVLVNAFGPDGAHSSLIIAKFKG